MFVFKPDLGIIATVFKYFGWQQVEWFTNPSSAMYVIIIAAIWMQVGGTMVIFLAGLQSIDLTLYEAAAIDGASIFQRFWYITLPKLRAVALFNFVTGLIFALSVFDISYIISGGTGGPADGTMTVVLHLWIYGFQFMKMGYACAVAFVLAIIIIVATVLQNFIFRSGADE
jgi:multiple sugar transport system permease protein